MHRNTITKSLFLKGEPSFLGLSEALRALNRVRSQDALDNVARQIIEVANHARLLWDSELCSEAGTLLLSLPLSSKLRSVAEYYTTPLRLPSAADVDDARKHLLRCADNAENRYVARIILKIGHLYFSEGDLEEALRYFVEAGKAAATTDPLAAVQAARTIAMLRGALGDNAGALRELESLWPIIRSISSTYPHLRGSHLNNIAVELSATGRTEEARIAIQAALLSPLAHRFPEWRETQREIEDAAQKEARRSPATATVVLIPAPEAQAREVRARSTKKAGERFVIPGTDIRKVGAFIPLPFRNGLPVVSLLERYVKTVRIRQP